MNRSACGLALLIGLSAATLQGCSTKPPRFESPSSQLIRVAPPPPELLRPMGPLPKIEADLDEAPASEQSRPGARK